MNRETAVDAGVRRRVEACVIEAIAGFGAARAHVTPDAPLPLWPHDHHGHGAAGPRA